MNRAAIGLTCMLLAAAPVLGEQDVALVAGENFFGLTCEPDDPSLGAIFGNASLPGGDTAADATLIQVYASSPFSQPAASYRRDRGGRWVDAHGAPADGVRLQAWRGYSIVLPASAAPRSLTIRGTPATVAPDLEIGGAAGATNYNVLAWSFPERVAIRSLGLREAGLAGGVNVQQSDEIRILDNSSGMGSRQAPKARIWINAATGKFELSPGGGSAEDYLVEPGEALIIVRKRAPGLLWRPASPSSAADPQHVD